MKIYAYKCSGIIIDVHRKIKIMKKYITTFAFFISLLVVANAQKKSESMSAEDRASKVTEKLVEPLKLTDKQKADINSINLKSLKEAEGIEAQMNVLKEKKKKIVDGTNTKIKEVLTPEQAKKLDQLMEKRDEKKQGKAAAPKTASPY